jgi:hypothetical protein
VRRTTCVPPASMSCLPWRRALDRTVKMIHTHAPRARSGPAKGMAPNTINASRIDDSRSVGRPPDGPVTRSRSANFPIVAPNHTSISTKYRSAIPALTASQANPNPMSFPSAVSTVTTIRASIRRAAIRIGTPAGVRQVSVELLDTKGSLSVPVYGRSDATIFSIRRWRVSAALASSI